ncbi:MAG TPA: hypothetical protein VLD63_06485 [Anaerolineales bacterium]|nr:hypothetical protein [Anaerolineales bacterium]
MLQQEHPAIALSQAVDGLEEPYRRNAVQWLEGCMQTSVHSLEEDLRAFLDELHPIVRESFVQHSRRLLSDALDHFGKNRKGRRPVSVHGRTDHIRLLDC